jgi:hypothetical protein
MAMAVWKALDVDSSKVIDLEKLVLRGDLDPIFLDSSYYFYPDGLIAAPPAEEIGSQPTSCWKGMYSNHRYPEDKLRISREGPMLCRLAAGGK